MVTSNFELGTEPTHGRVKLVTWAFLPGLRREGEFGDLSVPTGATQRG